MAVIKKLASDIRSRIVEAFGENIAAATEAHVEAGATERGAFAVALRDAGKSNVEVGEAFGPVFGTVTKPGGAGNQVTSGLRALGRDAEITGGAGGGGGRKVVVRDSTTLLRDEIDRLRGMLDNVTKPVDEMNADLATLDSDPASVVALRVEEIDATVKALQAEKKGLNTGDGASAYVATERERITAKRDAAATASAENADRMREGLTSLEATLSVIESMGAPTTEA